MAWRCWTVLLAIVVAGRAAFAQAGAGRAAPDGLTPFARSKAETLLRDRLPCLGCHTLGGKGGTLAPELSTVSQRRPPEYIARMVANPQATVSGTVMPHTPMPAEWRRLIIQYLGGQPSENAGSARVPAVPASRRLHGEARARHVLLSAGLVDPLEHIVHAPDVAVSEITVVLSFQLSAFSGYQLGELTAES